MNPFLPSPGKIWSKEETSLNKTQFTDDGYRLTYGGLDYLALHTHQQRQTLYSTGQQIGTGKESDIHITASPSGTQHALKIHRLGRISFRSVKNNRDYLRHRSSASWMYMSRLAAVKEFAFMTALHKNGFPVPRPVAQSRHTLVMELIEGLPLRQVQEIPQPERLYAELIDLVLALADVGLIHGDFNEFNILIRTDEVPPVEKRPTEESLGIPQPPSIKLTPILIDFPQMLSIDHPNAEMYFDRDVACIKRFFERRFHFTSDEPGPFFADVRKLASMTAASDGSKTRVKRGKESGKRAATRGGEKVECWKKRLDVEVEASGFSRKMAKELEKYMQDVRVNGDKTGGGASGSAGEDGNETEGDSSDLNISANDEFDQICEADND